MDDSALAPYNFKKHSYVTNDNVRFYKRLPPDQPKELVTKVTDKIDVERLADAMTKAMLDDIAR
jgi:hypothetical protein